MARDHARSAEKLGRNGRLARAHREVVADRKHRDIRCVDATDQSHVTEDVGIAGEVEGGHPRELDDESARLARVGALVGRRVVRMGQRHARAQQVDAAALVDGLPHVLADLRSEHATQLDLGDHGTRERAGEPDGVADVVVVAVRDQNPVDSLRLELGCRARRVARQPRIDIDPVAPRRVEAEGGMAEPGDRSRHGAQITPGPA